MRKVILSLILFLTLGVSNVFSQYEGTVGLGAHAGYAKEINSLGAGVHLHYYYTNSLRFAPSYTHFVPINGRNMWEMDVDAHYIVPLSWEFSLYPIGGLSYSKWKYKPSGNDGIDNLDWSKRRAGLNLGVGFQYDFKYKARTNLEVKYQSIKGFSQLNVMVGIGFWI